MECVLGNQRARKYAWVNHLFETETPNLKVGFPLTAKQVFEHFKELILIRLKTVSFLLLAIKKQK